ncbi:transcription repressor ofp7 [Phtheirospermum japonicum]|uniref:Transcription repressor n=1 Tax=Phtheirospermum japonicum TaxID=374723 RepID=A0A830D213_9LAMI|nr:transcription repressor ofp7 [Phtheirospermum japonicum]
MAKRFKVRICRAIANTLESCRSKDPSILPQDPVPSFPPRSHFSLPRDHPTAANRHLSSAFVAGGPHPLHFKWQKDEKWHVVAKIHQPHLKTHSSDADDLTFAPPPPPSSADKNRRRRKKKKNIPSRLRLSTSSADSGWFSSDGGGGGAEIEEEETETLVSSPDASSEFNPQPVRETRRNKSRRPVSRKTKRGGAEAEGEAPARLSMFKKLIPCTVDGKVKESFAVVKRSADPYEDFKKSMMDMILEKQMFEPDDLEQLLQCFVSLNARHYHGIIVQAFSEIWEAIFYPPASSNNMFNQ